MQIPTRYDPFWQLSAGNIITLAVMLLSFWGAHRANRRHIEDSAAQLQEMKTRVEIMYNWFTIHIIGSGKHGD